MRDTFLRAALDMLNLNRPDIAADLIAMHDAEVRIVQQRLTTNAKACT